MQNANEKIDKLEPFKEASGLFITFLLYELNDGLVRETMGPRYKLWEWDQEYLGGI